jgi:hypothetical protein
VCMSVGGGAVNLFCCGRLLGQYRRRTIFMHQVRACPTNYKIFLQFDSKTAFLLLKIHLTLANLIVVLIVCPIRAVWLISYRWPFGRIMLTNGSDVLVIRAYKLVLLYS